MDFDLSTLRVVAMGLRFPEGPIALDDGSVLVVEIEGGAVMRVHPDGSKREYRCGGGPNGAALGPDGAVYVCNDGGLAFVTEGEIRLPNALAPGNEGGYVRRLDLESGAVETMFTHVEGVRIGGLNDIVFDATGCCYIVDTVRGALYYCDPLRRTIRSVEQGLEVPDDMGLSPAGDKLYVSETYSGRIFCWDVAAPGALSGKREHYNAGGEHGWDGLAIDGAGNVCASNLTKSGVSVIDPAGRKLADFVTPQHDPFVTNICFGADEAYIRSSGRGLLYAIKWPWPGLRLHCAR
jgi:gluconolactonase